MSDEVSRLFAKQLRDLDTLRAALAELDADEVGQVMALVLVRWGEVGDTPLVDMLRVIADWLEQGQKPSDLIEWRHADGQTSCIFCGQTYRDHEARSYGKLVLHEICGGGLVKL